MEDAIRGKATLRRTERAAKKTGEAASGKAGKGRILDRIASPGDLKRLSVDELRRLCGEIREHIVEVVAQKGGHLGPSLGVVELTVALEATLDLPRDRTVWDTGHQGYVHKILTGRRDDLWSIRQYGGISGFLKRTESPYDAWGAGHASTAISGALGMATARDLAGEDHKIVAVIGDGAMTGGLAYEALNNAGQAGRNLLVILNDNGMSISPNVGAIAHYLTAAAANPHLKKLRDDALHLIRRLPALGGQMEEVARRLETAVKTVVIPGGLFQALGFNYFGPVDGHDVGLLMDLLPKVLGRKGPVLLHVLTTKGKGLSHAEKHHESFHGVSPFDKKTGKAIGAGKPSPPAYTAVFGRTMMEAAETFPRLTAITAAMATGTGLAEFRKTYPDRFFDVGIAESHGVCFAAGLACDGIRPVVAVYSTFLQRAFDQIVHDVALQRLPVVFALDRAGLVGADGPTHHGVLDLAYLRTVPHMVVAAPKDGNELRDLLWTAFEYEDGPFAVRYPRGRVPKGFDPDRAPQSVPIGSWELLREGADVAFLAVGTMVGPAVEAAERLAKRGVSAAVADCRFVKPMDREMLLRLRSECGVLVTLEEGNLPGGFGAGILETLDAEGLSLEGVVRLGLPDGFVTHGSREQLLEDVGLTAKEMERRALEALERSADRPRVHAD